MGKEQFRFIWERAMTLQPDIQPTTKHVLLTLAVFMDEKATCFPSVSLLSERTGLSRRCVCEHLEKANKFGWIKTSLAGHNGKGWKRHKYKAMIPDNVVQELHCLNDKALIDVQYDMSKVVTQDNHVDTEGGYSDAEGGYSDDIKVVTQGHTNTIKNTTKNTTISSMPLTDKLFLNIPLKDGTEYSILHKDLNAWQESFPSLDVAQEIRSLRQWNIDNPKRRKTRTYFRRHVNGWLIKEQRKVNKNGTSIQNAGKPTTEQRKYDSVPELVIDV